jgi:ubiquinone biosynthesis protein Coq4
LPINFEIQSTLNIDFRNTIITKSVHGLALPMLGCFLKPQKLPMALSDMEHLPAGTLGKELTCFFYENKIGLLNYFQTHDLKHVLLDYGTCARDEAAMQFFYLGNKHYSIATIMSVINSLLLLPEHIGEYKRAWKRGLAALPIGKLPLEKMLACQITEIRNQFKIHPR